jgi:hypothetical protein
MKKGILALLFALLGFITPASFADDIPMTIDGQINCAHPANAITTTCRGEAPPPPVNTPPVTTEVTHTAPQAGTTITYSGNQSADCSLDSNKNLTMCIPMTINGEINCANSANSITTTCWDRAQSEKAAGKPDSSGVDCTQEKFKDYPVCTGVKPQAVVDYEKSQAATLFNAQKLNSDSATALSAAGETNTAQLSDETPAAVSGSVELKSRGSKTTSVAINLDTPGAKVKVVASKKGSKSITQTVTVNSQGDKTVKFDLNLKGYTVKIIVDGQIVDQAKL